MMRDIVLPEGLCFRNYEPSCDESFVYAAFKRRAWAHRMVLTEHMTTSQAHEALGAILNRLLRKATCLILCDTDDMSAIVGFIIFERCQRRVAIHFAYVKEGLRALKFGSLLWRFATRDLHKDDTIWLSTLTPRARNILDAHRVPYQLRPALLHSDDTFAQSNHQDNIRHAQEEDNHRRQSV